MPPRHSSARFTRLLSAFALTGLIAGCATGAPQQPFSSQWRQTAPNGYTNIRTGQTINREQYSVMVAREVYAQLTARPGSTNGRYFCK